MPATFIRYRGSLLTCRLNVITLRFAFERPLISLSSCTESAMPATPHKKLRSSASLIVRSSTPSSASRSKSSEKVPRAKSSASPSFERPPRAIVIAGAGVIGTAVAYHLTSHAEWRKGVDTLVLCEAHEVAAGASGKAGGFLSSQLTREM